MKIAFWNSSYLNGIGGAEKFVNDLLNYYSRKEIKQLFLITNKSPNKQKVNALFQPLPGNVKVYCNSFYNPLLSIKQPLIFFIKLFFYFKAAVQFGFFLKKNKIQIIHLHLVNIDVLLLVLYKFLFQYKLILTFTGLELELAKATWHSKLKLQLALKYADEVTAVSSDICLRLRQKFEWQQVHYIQNGIDLKQVMKHGVVSRLKIKEDQFIYCGRLTPVKRVAFLIDAFYDCIKTGFQKDLYIIGDGEERDKIKSLIKFYGIEKRVIMMGSLSHRQVMEMMNLSQCLILSSTSEACPMVVLEAFSLSKPVIVPDVGGMRDIVHHGKNGYLYPVERKDQLSFYMKEIAQDEKRSKEMGQKGTEIIRKKFDLEKVGKRYLDLYKVK